MAQQTMVRSEARTMREGLLDLARGQAGRGEGLVPVGGAGGGGELLEAVGVFADEGLVDGALGLEDQLVEEAEEGLVAADADLQEQVGERGALEHAAGGSAGS